MRGTGKFNQLKYLKKTKARVAHECNNCKVIISVREYYYKESIDDRFLQSLHSKNFCAKCYETYGEKLLADKEKRSGNGKDNLLNGYLRNQEPYEDET